MNDTTTSPLTAVREAENSAAATIGAAKDAASELVRTAEAERVATLQREDERLAAERTQALEAHEATLQTEADALTANTEKDVDALTTQAKAHHNDAVAVIVRALQQ